MTPIQANHFAALVRADARIKPADRMRAAKVLAVGFPAVGKYAKTAAGKATDPASNSARRWCSMGALVTIGADAFLLDPVARALGFLSTGHLHDRHPDLRAKMFDLAIAELEAEQ
jgi:hypothetical protein